MPQALRYTRDHEWARAEADKVVVGITDYAQDALGDIVFVDLPETGRVVAAGDEVGEVESTKTVSSVMAPVAGEVLEVNEELGAQPERINSDPFGGGWLFTLRPADPSELDGLMDEAAYRAYVESLSR